jgi:hypothetical protein
MKYIAHRGLINGPNDRLENLPSQIESVLDKGYDCEIDLWTFSGNLYLGHDGPEYNVTESFIQQPGLWIHAKHLESLEYLTTTDLNYFWHQEDDYTLTSRGYIWTYPGKKLSANGIMVMPETVDYTLQSAVEAECFAICSDYILKIQSQRP